MRDKIRITVVIHASHEKACRLEISWHKLPLEQSQFADKAAAPPVPYRPYLISIFPYTKLNRSNKKGNVAADPVA
jgi:hypothetical protein